MDSKTHQNISGAIIFLEEHCQGDYFISNNRIIYNNNLRIPDIKGISNVNLSVVDVNGNVKVSTNEQLKFEYLPTAKRYFGLNPNNLSFEKGSKVSRKQLEAKGFSKKFCHEISRRQFFNFLNQLPSRLGKMFSF